MASASSDLLAFKDYEDYGESPQISVNSPKKVSNNGKRNSFFLIEIKLFLFFVEETPTSSKKSIFQIEYYQQFFDIDTIEVINRIATSMIYKRAHSNYMRTNLGKR